MELKTVQLALTFDDLVLYKLIRDVMIRGSENSWFSEPTVLVYNNSGDVIQDVRDHDSLSQDMFKAGSNWAFRAKVDETYKMFGWRALRSALTKAGMEEIAMILWADGVFGDLDDNEIDRLVKTALKVRQ